MKGRLPVFTSVLVANRGEIAVRIFRTLRAMGIETVAVHSDVEAHAPHVRAADRAVEIGGGPVGESYLNVEAIIRAALMTGAQAIHPGYGLLSENSGFARAVEAAGLVFIGPPADAMDRMGSKIAARKEMSAAGVPVVPGSDDAVSTVAQAVTAAAEIGYPVAVKASGGGGGKGFRIARTPDEIAAAFEGASSEGERFFADPVVYLERYLENPRHVEVQVLADGFGTVIHLGERDCSVQRRHQKLIEESPAPAVTSDLREQIGAVAVQAARAVGYRSAGTVEGLLVAGEFYFLEMNTRIQVEHGVTEMVTGIDLIEEQVRIAAGEPLRHTQESVSLSGHSIECRINAEDAAKGFIPRPGAIDRYREPWGEHIRVDSGVAEGSEVHRYYDPMVAKVIVWGSDREAATERMIAALDDFEIGPIPTLVPFHRALLQTPQWQRGETCADLVGDRAWLRETTAHG
ncbi:acetyl/propionyl/methylcrotonyl-CoA carboxylase subunit alpha [Nocardia sp. NPDC060220]|uniref:acetyl-CoA carboxylase biotin carboxylase subunit n=1 Tax=Nocardia sp. NPDC060220 TaxID=3347076 RepID=UPI00366421DC